MFHEFLVKPPDAKQSQLPTIHKDEADRSDSNLKTSQASQQEYQTPISTSTFPCSCAWLFLSFLFHGSTSNAIHFDQQSMNAKGIDESPNKINKCDGLHLGPMVPMTLVAVANRVKAGDTRLSLFWYSSFRSGDHDSGTSADPSGKQPQELGSNSSAFFGVKRIQTLHKGFEGALVTHADACAIADVFFAEAHEASEKINTSSTGSSKGGVRVKKWRVAKGESSKGSVEGRAGIFGHSTPSGDGDLTTALPIAILKIPEIHRCGELNVNGIPPRNRCIPLFTFEELVRAIQNLHRYVPLRENTLACTASIQRYVIAKGNNPWLIRVESSYKQTYQWRCTETTNVYCINGKSHFMACDGPQFVPDSVKEANVLIHHVNGANAWEGPKECADRVLANIQSALSDACKDQKGASRPQDPFQNYVHGPSLNTAVQKLLPFPRPKMQMKRVVCDFVQDSCKTWWLLQIKTIEIVKTDHKQSPPALEMILSSLQDFPTESVPACVAFFGLQNCVTATATKKPKQKKKVKEQAQAVPDLVVCPSKDMKSAKAQAKEALEHAANFLSDKVASRNNCQKKLGSRTLADMHPSKISEVNGKEKKSFVGGNCCIGRYCLPQDRHGGILEGVRVTPGRRKKIFWFVILADEDERNERLATRSAPSSNHGSEESDLREWKDAVMERNRNRMALSCMVSVCNVCYNEYTRRAKERLEKQQEEHRIQEEARRCGDYLRYAEWKEEQEDILRQEATKQYEEAMRQKRLNKERLVERGKIKEKIADYRLKKNMKDAKNKVESQSLTSKMKKKRSRTVRRAAALKKPPSSKKHTLQARVERDFVKSHEKQREMRKKASMEVAEQKQRGRIAEMKRQRRKTKQKHADFSKVSEQKCKKKLDSTADVRKEETTTTTCTINATAKCHIEEVKADMDVQAKRPTESECFPVMSVESRSAGVGKNEISAETAREFDDMKCLSPTASKLREVKAKFKSGSITAAEKAGIKDSFLFDSRSPALSLFGGNIADSAGNSSTAFAGGKCSGRPELSCSSDPNNSFSSDSGTSIGSEESNASSEGKYENDFDDDY